MKGPIYSPRRPDPTAPWTNEEVAARLEAAFELWESEYHYTPSPDDWTALRKACEILRLGGERVCESCGRSHGPDKDCL